jgi:glutamate-1-semialdehyde 2,1-aminomutase
MSHHGDLIDIYTKELTKRTQKSMALHEESLNFTPLGVHSNWRIFDPYPIFMSKAKGSRIWDVDGNEYLDYNMAFGALTAGHAHPVLVEAVIDRVQNGTIFGFEAEEVVKLSKVVTERFGFDMCRFSSTGLEATQLAIRLARAFTGRSKILKFEGCYHGSHDGLLVSIKPEKYKAGHPKAPVNVPAGNGIPESMVDNVVIAPFNDINAVEELMGKYGNEIAGIILETIPMNMGVILPEDGFLEGLRELADEYNCMLIFDDVKLCGKFYGGSPEFFGVKPDILTVGKSVAGGYPLSAVLADEEVMEIVGPGKVAHGGTFNSNPLAVRAAYVTLTDILTKEAMQYTHRLSDKLAKGYSDILEDRNINAHLVTAGNSGLIYFCENRVRNWRDFLNYVDFGSWFAWALKMILEGIIPQALGFDEQWTVSVQHTEEEIQKTVEVADGVFREIKEHIGKIQQLKVEEAI